MKSSLKKIERIKDILDLNGSVLTYKYSDEDIRLNLGEEQLSSIFSRFLKIFYKTFILKQFAYFYYFYLYFSII